MTTAAVPPYDIGPTSHGDHVPEPIATPRLLPRHDLPTTGGRYLLVYGDLLGEPPRDDPSRPEEVARLQQRLDRLTDTWIAVSPARNVRPHSSLDRSCPLCPGGPELPFPYRAAVFENRFPSLRADPPPVPDDARFAPSIGRCEVVLYTQEHTGSLATLSPDELANVVAIWRDRTADLWADERHRFVMPFENRGEPVGATLSHPHGQIYAFDHLPPLVALRAEAARAHALANGGECLGCRVVAEDVASERIVATNDSFAVAVPFAPHWPFEIHVRAKRHGAHRLSDLTPVERRDLAAALRDVVLRYDALFGFELPYMMVLLDAPADASGDAVDGWHFAVEFYPPHRNERLTKVRASVETATGFFINDTLPEVNAARLAALGGERPIEVEAVEVVRAMDDPGAAGTDVRGAP